MNSIHLACQAFNVACRTILQKQLNASKAVVDESTEFCKILQTVDEINQLQQDVVMLNIGGHAHHLSKQSATRHRDSFFGALFSEMFDPSKCIEPEFIDRDGETFSAIASYLRNGEWVCDIRYKERVEDECAFYCLPSPRSLPTFAWSSCISKPWMIHFTAENHAPQCESLPFPSHYTQLRSRFAVTNATSLYIAKESTIFEHEYVSAQWRRHDMHEPTYLGFMGVCATNDALYATDSDANIYQMQLNGDWRWSLIKKRSNGSGWVISTSNNTIVTVDDSAVLTYNNHTQSWDKVCTAPPGGCCQWCVVTQHWVYACTCSVFMCKVGGTVWKRTSNDFHTQYRTRHIHEVCGALHIFTIREHFKCDIAIDGSLADLVKVKEFQPEHLKFLGIRNGRPH